MVAFRNLDKNGDMTFGKGVNNYLKNNDAIRLDINTRINSWLGDCFFDTEAGIDWFNRLGSKGQRTLLEEDLRLIILQTTGVTGITSFSTNVNDRKFNASYTVITEYSKEFTDVIERSI